MGKLKADERVSIELRELYQQYGYLPYKVSKFEEYDLYMQNKSFLESEHVLAFSDMDGKLMALKPDITLSIIKNSRDEAEPLKVSYAETVYRVPRGAYGFKEIMQTGLEFIGEVDAYAMGEVLMLAARSLETISADWALDIADLSIISGVLESEGLSGAQTAQLLSLIGEKNLHGLAAQCGAFGISETAARQLSSLVSSFGPLEETLEKILEMNLPPACQRGLADLSAIAGMMKVYGIRNINLDFSVVNDMNYYSGLIFAGFIEGIPSGVLSGGRYDYLMRRMGRKNQAIGFAVYLDQLERLMDERAAYDVDVLITYGAGTAQRDIIAAAQTATANGQSVRVQRSGDTQIRSRCRMDL
ncbi:MAG: ATP phosphoribosyltransferase regulatory subunit [Clostridia bacterium]|nr:ATP phosphoribosyltransferase regulatory subunit [Clostridia bacterium]